MHAVTLGPSFRAALMQRRGGREHVYHELTPGRTALIVCDMQSVFVAPGGLLEVPAARGIVTNIRRLADVLREAGCAIAWVQSTFGDTGRSRWDAYFDHLAPAARRDELRRAFRPDHPAHALWHEFEPAPGDAVIDKDRYSPFAPGASRLDAWLAEREIDTLVITGTATNVCCECTARDAMMLDYRCVLVEDATAAATDEDHLAALANVARYFGDVVTTEGLLGTMAGAAL